MKNLRIGVDIGGVISKYPDFFRKFLRVLQDGGAEIFIVTDMHDMQDIIKQLKENQFDFIPESNIYSADYAQYGNAAKQIVAREFYCMRNLLSCVRLLDINLVGV